MPSPCARVAYSATPELLNSTATRFIPPAKLHHNRSKCGLSRRSFAFKGIVAAGATVMSSSMVAEPSQGLDRLPYKSEGYNFWTWRGHRIHYVEQGEGEGIPIVLIHGFGASAFHWRYNIPELAKKYKVYAIDLLGFGWSEKALVEYDALVWRDQVTDFLKEIVKEPAIVVGNSLGGFTALMTAEALPEQVAGVVLLNSAGQFGNGNEVKTESEESGLQKLILNPLKTFFQRIVLGFLFWQAKQPARIQSVLKSVYINPSNVDDYLVESITRPADDPNAGEVYYRFVVSIATYVSWIRPLKTVYMETLGKQRTSDPPKSRNAGAFSTRLMSRFMSNQSKYTLDSVLSKLSCPLLLLWGDLDPWVGPVKAIRIKEFYPNTSLVSLQAGHCPHDEVPELVNKALLEWLSTLPSKPSLQTL